MKLSDPKEVIHLSKRKGNGFFFFNPFIVKIGGFWFLLRVFLFLLR
jgi:hypothetical protein